MIEKIAFNRGVRNDEPNIELAEFLVKGKDGKGMLEIVRGLEDENPQVQSDCIKVLYEVGYRNPELISEYVGVFLKHLKSKNNRLVWGSAIALSTIAGIKADSLFKEFDAIFKIYQNGSVITIDNCISIFAGISKTNKKYEEKIFPILVNHLTTCRPKEVAQHAERVGVSVNSGNFKVFKDVLLGRYDSLTGQQKKRIEKLLKKLNDLKD